MKYKGSCHCGKIAFEVEGTIDVALSCNCSLCSRKGALLWLVSRDNLTLLSADDAAGTYTFNKHVVKHRFCPHCGIQPYSENLERLDANGNRMTAINLRCLDGIDLSTIPVREFNGRGL